jgi:hypothetical protein
LTAKDEELTEKTEELAQETLLAMKTTRELIDNEDLNSITRDHVDLLLDKVDAQEKKIVEQDRKIFEQDRTILEMNIRLTRVLKMIHSMTHPAFDKGK